MYKNIEELIKKIENLDWSIAEEGDTEYRIGKFSPQGQDFSITIEGEDPETLIRNIKEAYDNYDVSTETYLWLDDSGHGTNGAPYEMKDVLEDMQACKDSILELHADLIVQDYDEINLPLGTTIDQAVEVLLRHKAEGKHTCFKFNDKILYSDTVTLDDAYLQVTGKSKSEWYRI